MLAVEENINRINNKIKQLLKNYAILKKENEQLNAALKNNQIEIETSAEKINQLQQQISILKLSTNQMNEVDKKALQKNINQYIKEIEKCIGILSE